MIPDGQKTKGKPVSRQEYVYENTNYSAYPVQTFLTKIPCPVSGQGIFYIY